MKRPGTVALDVREPDEYEQGALKGAVHMPRGFLGNASSGSVPERTTPIVVYCAGGTRSAFAADTLAQLGYTDVVSMAGGFNRWKDEGLGWEMPAVLSPEQRNRYQRHLLLPEVDVEGQVKLLRSKVLLLGAGGLGSPAALYLAAAGVGTLGVVDMDVVDASNLQRQILHNLDRIGDRKVDSAKKTITSLNPDVNVVTYDVRLGADNIMDVLSGYDLVVDGTDNFPTRYLVNDASLKLDIPVVHGSIFRFEGQASVYLPHPGRATAARCPSRLPPTWPRRARRPGCWACCPGSSAHYRRWRRSRCCSPSESRLSAGCWLTTPWKERSARSGSTGTPSAQLARSPRNSWSSPSTTSSACRTRCRHLPRPEVPGRAVAARASGPARASSPTRTASAPGASSHARVGSTPSSSRSTASPLGSSPSTTAAPSSKVSPAGIWTTRWTGRSRRPCAASSAGELGLPVRYFEQLYTFGDRDRVTGGRSMAVAYLALARHQPVRRAPAGRSGGATTTCSLGRTGARAVRRCSTP